jgi:DNA polymerase elongation subunit (family B)
VLEPIITRRVAYKRKSKSGGPEAEGFKMRADALKWVLVTCFGYTGYRNARFGRIECHESITAFGREILIDACHIAQDHGFEVLHGIVDSMWLKGPTEKAQECAQAISKQVGIPLEVEGTYKWLVFLPNKGNGVGALNRYYGAFEDGHLKVRGVDVRKRDTPRFFSEFQSDALDILAKAGDGKEFREMLPECLALAKERAQDLRFGEADVEDLIFTRSVSGTLEDYRTVNLQACCLYLLEQRGIKVAPGQSVRFVVCDDKSPDPATRVTPDMFLGPDTKYDAGYYVRHLARTLESLTLPFGLTEEKILAQII